MRDPSLNLALVSVPGDYAAAEALKAIKLGMSVMIFSDNVPVDAELELKRAADERDLIVMGPDCGTAIVNGIPLGFANVVRRGADRRRRRVGHRHAGGHGAHPRARLGRLAGDRHRRPRPGRGDRRHLDAARRCAGWRTTPRRRSSCSSPSRRTRPSPRAVLAQAAAMTTPVVSIFLGADPERRRPMASSPRAASPKPPTSPSRSPTAARRARGARRSATTRARGSTRSWPRAAPEQRFVRGIFSGGTFCFEAQLILRAQRARRLVQHAGARQRDARRHRARASSTRSSTWATTQFTQGRPHPMIDPGLRDERLACGGGRPGGRGPARRRRARLRLDDGPRRPGSSRCSRRARQGRDGRLARSSTSAARPPTRRTARASVAQLRGVRRARRRDERRRRRRGRRTSRPSSPRAERPMTGLFTQELNVANVGLPDFADNIRAAGGSAVQLDWRPPGRRRRRRRHAARPAARRPADRGRQRHGARALPRGAAGARRHPARRATRSRR